MKSAWMWVVVPLIVLRCASEPHSPKNSLEGDYNGYHFYLENYSSVHQRLRCEKDGRLLNRFVMLPFEVYKMEVGDVNQNGRPDISLGVVKESPLDSVMRRRLFIYELQNEKIVPIWRGSRLPQPLHDFHWHTQFDPPLLRTVEIGSNRLYLISEYQMGSFGPDFLRTTHQHLDLKTAERHLFHEN